jgi:hypothetical protein
MTTLYEHRTNISENISTKRPLLVLCCILFVAALLPFVFGLQAAHQLVSVDNAPIILYDSDCNPFGSILTCVEVQAEGSVPPR